ncbi:hypothetical protein QJS10_CPA09g00546 [Acorus calamus]|uniref:Polymerase/histidinol phosphatase N-terminal domain-containing protein n=1 Tax=Acorus calamus TaxID=4465 RepID=A0AAV9E8T1_ACOCL|nr:hypothetical protein QJS10_CPA09g00546 [Acorus calamus]
MNGISNSKRERRRKKRTNKKNNRRTTAEQAAALRWIGEWVSLASSSPPPPPQPCPPSSVSDDFQVSVTRRQSSPERPAFELHLHSFYSDGYLSPSALVERAHRNGVRVLALTDHDTLAGIPEALQAAYKFGIRIIPGVEISAVFSPRRESASEEPVHILAYYGSCGPVGFEELDNCLSSIRDGRYTRAKTMLSKLKSLNMPLKWEHLVKIAGNGVAPGRLHVARAMVEAGHVENLKQAFSRYLFDGGPAYARGNEPHAEEVVKLICQTGGVAALAHPWALKSPIPIIRSLKAAGLHGIEVYRSDGKFAAFSDLADTYGLLKLGGSDYHGRGGHDESDLGSVNLPILTVYEFMKLARPIWCNAIRDILQSLADAPSDSKLERILKFGRLKYLKGEMSPSCCKDIADLCYSSWLTNEEKQSIEFEAIRCKLSDIVIHNSNGFQIL